MKTQVLWLAIFFVVFLFGVEKANGCSCLGTEKPTAEFRKTPVVFVGTVKVVKSADSRKLGEEFNFNDSRTTFYIDESLKGVKGSEIDIYTSSQGTACGIRFVVGEQYLIYAYGGEDEQKYYTTNICTRTRLANSREDEIAVLRSISKGAFEPRIYGRVEEIVRGIYLLDRQENVPLSNIRVIANNGVNVYQTTTDMNGNFRFVNIKTGNYRLAVDLPSTHKFGDDSWASVEKTGTDYSYPVTTSDSPDFITVETRIDGRIKGKVVDEKGKSPGKGIMVSLISRETARKEPGDIDYVHAYTDENGNFEFYGLPAGEYYLGFNLETRPSKDFPYPRTYFPGAPEIEKAKTIALGRAEKLGGFVLILPPKVEEIEITGKVIDADGKPVKGAVVERYGLYNGEWREGDPYLLKYVKQPTFEGRVETDEKGEFTFKLLKGNKYRLNAFSGEKKDAVDIEVGDNPKPVNLVLDQKPK